MKRFWQSLFGWPLLFLLLIAALWCAAEVIAEARFNPPPPGILHRLNVGEDSSRCLVLRIPIGWEPQQVPPRAPDYMTAVFLRATDSYPSVYVKAKVLEETQPLDWSGRHADAQRIRLLAETTNSKWVFDSERKVRWRTVTQKSPGKSRSNCFAETCIAYYGFST
ncbi:hypothetical protein [Thalassoroseus pseudoceratinae]|uniref:hypothetical protein n=1 Tax=Thalassoroseus pseudoceratinae TaxID=2713176 RepID=UPI001421679F|nr:hypothetical protein [Thalassoroseus pseudoceratinae]